jgi:hypothetical protein
LSVAISKYQNSYFLGGSDLGQSKIYSFDSSTYTENTGDRFNPGYSPGIAISSIDINEQRPLIPLLTIASNGWASPAMIVRDIIMNTQTYFYQATLAVL